jgi:DNA polymerase III subunit epsilon
MVEASRSRWAVVDVETTGLHPVRDRIVEIAVVRLGINAELMDEWSTLVNPGDRALGGRIHGLRAADLEGAPSFGDIRDDLLARLAGNVIVAHNAPFDVSFLQAETVRDGVAWGPVEGLCTMELLRALGIAKSRKLHQCCAELEIWAGREHVAIDDARAVAGIMSYLAPRLWAVGAPPAAPDWPAPARAAEVKPRTSPTAPEPIAEVGRHFRLPPDMGISNAASTTYLGLLDQVVEDGRVTDEEVEALGLFARACGITRPIARQLHIAYLEEMSRIAQADGIVTEEEQRRLSALVPLLSASLPR